MPESAAAEFVIQGSTLDGKVFLGGDHRMQYSPFVHPITMNGVRCVVVDRRLELINFAKDNELRVREGRIEERTRLAELQRVGDTA